MYIKHYLVTGIWLSKSVPKSHLVTKPDYQTAFPISQTLSQQLLVLVLLATIFSFRSRAVD